MAVVITDDIHLEMAEIAINSANRATDMSLQYLGGRDFRSFGMLVMDVGTYVDRAFSQCNLIENARQRMDCAVKVGSAWSNFASKLEVGLRKAK